MVMFHSYVRLPRANSPLHGPFGNVRWYIKFIHKYHAPRACSSFWKCMIFEEPIDATQTDSNWDVHENLIRPISLSAGFSRFQFAHVSEKLKCEAANCSFCLFIGASEFHWSPTAAVHPVHLRSRRLLNHGNVTQRVILEMCEDVEDVTHSFEPKQNIWNIMW